MSIITVPGIHGSGPRHWQTMWENQDAEIERFSPASWDSPDLQDWCQALESSVRTAQEPPILVAHSLGTLLVAHWAARSDAQVAGTFLVAVPDPAGPAFPAAAKGFAAPPPAALPFPGLVVASRTDPYSSMRFSRRIAEAWGAELVDVGDQGHINECSDLGEWAQGRQLLSLFVARLRDSAPADAPC